MPYVGLIWSLFTVESCQKRAGAFFCASQLLIDDLIACDSCWSIQGYNIFPFIARAGSILWMAEYLNGPFLKAKLHF